MRKKNRFFPRPVLKSLFEDIHRLIVNNEGRLYILEILEEVPYDLRPHILENLSAFYSTQMVDFYHLIKMEYGKELENIYQRALEKYNMAGLDTRSPEFFKGTFYRAYASGSRHTGRITLDVAWKTAKLGLHVECFYLTYRPDGIHSFLLIEDMPLQQYEQDREQLGDMVQIGLEEVCFLITGAYESNLCYMTRPAIGRFLYEKYLYNYGEYSDKQKKELVRKLSIRLTPRQIVNGFFHGIKYKDHSYLLSLVSIDSQGLNLIIKQFNAVITNAALLLEGKADDVYGSLNATKVNAHSISIEDNELFKDEYVFYLCKDCDAGWLIDSVEKKNRVKIDLAADVNPFNQIVYCKVYEIMDLDHLFDLLDSIDNIHEVEELPYGLHMRVSYLEEDFNHGLSFLTGVSADLMINGEEFVVVARNSLLLIDIDQIISNDQGLSVVSRGEYQVTLITACRYLGGQYPSFEEILLDEQEGSPLQNSMRFITIRYLIKNRLQVIKRIEGLMNLRVELPGSDNIYYQAGNITNSPGLFVEYILGSNWITLSTFGERDLNTARSSFEEDMYGCLEFDGIEIKENGVFDVLTSEVKKEYPQLEDTLKEIYLNKWYYARSSILSGMSPSEACQTEEGSRLLWTWLKNLTKNEKGRRLSGKQRNINLREYIQKVEQEKRGKH